MDATGTRRRLFLYKFTLFSGAFSCILRRIFNHLPAQGCSHPRTPPCSGSRSQNMCRSSNKSASTTERPPVKEKNGCPFCQSLDDGDLSKCKKMYQKQRNSSVFDRILYLLHLLWHMILLEKPIAVWVHQSFSQGKLTQRHPPTCRCRGNAQQTHGARQATVGDFETRLCLEGKWEKLMGETQMNHLDVAGS